MDLPERGVCKIAFAGLIPIGQVDAGLEIAETISFVAGLVIGLFSFEN